MHLLGADIVDGDNEDGFILLKQSFELIEIGCFVFRLAPHIFLLEVRIFKVQGRSIVLVTEPKCVSDLARVKDVCGLGCACRA